MSDLTASEFESLAARDESPDYSDPRGGRSDPVRIPIPNHDVDYGDPRGDLMRFIDVRVWGTIYEMLGDARSAGGNPLTDAVQALMCEVGQQHSFRVKVNALVNPDDLSDRACLEAIEFFAGSTVEPEPAPAVLVVDKPPPVSVEKLELALQEALASIDDAPSKLSIADFLELCRLVATMVEVDLGG